MKHGRFYRLLLPKYFLWLSGALNSVLPDLVPDCLPDPFADVEDVEQRSVWGPSPKRALC